MKNPCISETAFKCPHCAAFTTQFWNNCYMDGISSESRVPYFPDHDFQKEIAGENEWPIKEKEKILKWYEQIMTQHMFHSQEYIYNNVLKINNLHISECYNCKRISLWVYDKLVYPAIKIGNIPNKDLPAPIMCVVEEAREILQTSPKGAATLLRLSIQMLCKELGESGTDINSDIASLVKKGLNPVVQKALDVVRVIGNEAVHPGRIDLNDDRETAARLFDLVNVVAEQMISQPKMVQDIYDSMPENKKLAIKTRDEKNK